MPTTDNNQTRLLVTGASGNFGRLVVTHLLDTLKVEPQRIIAASRSPDKLQEFAGRGVQTRRLDFNDTASIEEAAKGVDRALLISGDDLFGRLAGQKAAVQGFETAGVKHVLYTSLFGVEDSIALVADDHRATEQAIRDSKISSHTFLRNGLYYDNNIGTIAGASKSGQWFTAAKDGKLAAISRDDLARAAAYALASTNYDNQIYELSGPEALNVDEIVAQISKTIGKPIQVIQVSTDDLTKGIAAATGLPEAVTKFFAAFDAATAAGQNAIVTEDFKKLTGVSAKTHEAWLEDHKALLSSF